MKKPMMKKVKGGMKRPKVAVKAHKPPGGKKPAGGSLEDRLRDKEM